MTTRERILEMLAVGNPSMRDMATACGVSVAALASTLRKMKHQGFVVGGPYQWALARKEVKSEV